NGIYFPETRGISLSGQLVGKETGIPLPEAKVYLSIIGDKDILVVRTDSAGKFFFALPGYYGRKDIFLCAEDLPLITPEILIDNDFCTRRVTLPSLRFSLTEEERKTAYQLAVNFEISSLYRPAEKAADSSEEKPDVPFYGKPTEVLVMDKYIELPTLEEYFTELVVMVKIKKVQGKKQFRFLSTQPEMSIYDPLVLVDWVAIDTIGKILKMSPRDIERIELIDAPYVKGDITYGGIISFVSKKNDFAGIDLPTSGTFVNYKFLEACSDSVTNAPLPATIPDSRNTVYWNPTLQTDDQGTATVTFTAPDTPGKYTILLRKINHSGEIISAEKTFTVSPIPNP
ncbi:MAG: hypothetical protein JXA23_10965, partial [Bacteroidales bacterium]|nr:hypothetical protein [Bacteroidales bacterium]